MEKIIRKLVGKIKCLLGYHDENTAFSWISGAYTVYCKRCGKVLEVSNGGIR